MDGCVYEYVVARMSRFVKKVYNTFVLVFFYLWMDITVNIVQTPAQLLMSDFSGDRWVSIEH